MSKTELEAIMLKQGIESGGRAFMAHLIIDGRVRSAYPTLVVSKDRFSIQAFDIDPATNELTPNTYSARNLNLTATHILGGGVVLQEYPASPVNQWAYLAELDLVRDFFNTRLQELKIEVGKRLGIPLKPEFLESNLGSKVDTVV
ncbi:hypothetical protein HYT74_00065 [Candidatus Daviesbacteria bacterium]|nr:hypothetical protein [Candidatus Daviesbacteria bacterium]